MHIVQDRDPLGEIEAEVAGPAASSCRAQRQNYLGGIRARSRSAAISSHLGAERSSTRSGPPRRIGRRRRLERVAMPALWRPIGGRQGGTTRGSSASPEKDDQSPADRIVEIRSGRPAGGGPHASHRRRGVIRCALGTGARHLPSSAWRRGSSPDDAWRTESLLEAGAEPAPQDRRDRASRARLRRSATIEDALESGPRRDRERGAELAGYGARRRSSREHVSDGWASRAQCLEAAEPGGGGAGAPIRGRGGTRKGGSADLRPLFRTPRALRGRAEGPISAGQGGEAGGSRGRNGEWGADCVARRSAPPGRPCAGPGFSSSRDSS